MESQTQTTNKQATATQGSQGTQPVGPPTHQVASIKKTTPFEQFKTNAKDTKIILDVDTGCDDAHCIVLLGYLSQLFGTQVLGITCTKGNSTLENVVTNSLISLQHTQLKVPVYKGASKNMMDYDSSDDYFGLDGLKGTQEQYKTELTEQYLQLEQKDKTAYQFIVESAHKYGKNLIIACAAPLTNIAIAYLLDNSIVDLIGGLSIMGGSYSGIGMNQAFSAEFNFFSDAEAASIVIKQFKNIVQIPLDLAFEFPRQQFTNLFTSVENARGKFITNIYKDMEDCLLCDPLILFPIFYPEVVKNVYRVYGQVVTEGKRTRGFLACNWLPNEETSLLQPNLQIASEFDYTFVNEVMHKLVTDTK